MTKDKPTLKCPNCHRRIEVRFPDPSVPNYALLDHRCTAFYMQMQGHIDGIEKMLSAVTKS